MEGDGGNSTVSHQAARDALSTLSGKWTPVVLLTLHEAEPLGFNDLLDSIPDISGKVLSDTLETLEDERLVERRVTNETPLRVEYDLTPAARDLEPVFEALSAWGRRYLESALPTVLVAGSDRRLTEMYGQWLADNYSVELAYNVAELESSARGTVDVAIIAVNLPGADLDSLLETVRSHCRTVLLVDGPPDVGLLDVPCDDVVRKPIVRSTALRVVEEQLARRGEPEEERDRTAQAAKRAILETARPEAVQDGTGPPANDDAP